MADMDPGHDLESIEVIAEIHGTDEQHPPSRSSSRQRKLTRKGLEYALHTKRKRLHQLYTSLEKITSKLQEMIDLNSTTDVAEEHVVYKKWTSLYSEFLDADNEFRMLLTEEDVVNYEENWFVIRNDTMRVFRAATESWFNMSTRKYSEDQRDDVSVASSRSKHSRCSTTRSTSQRLREEEKQAELRIRAEMLERKRSIEEQQLRLKHQVERITIEEEIAVSKARSDILSQADDVSVTSMRSRRDDPGVMAVVKHLTKPTFDLQKFDGEPLHYHRFMRQFRSKVVANCDDPEERLNYLEQYTTGDARQIVIGFSYLDAAMGYDAAVT